MFFIDTVDIEVIFLFLESDFLDLLLFLTQRLRLWDLVRTGRLL